MAFGDYLKKLGESLGSSEKRGLFSSVFNMAYGANQSRLAFERQQYLLNREHDLNEQSAEAAYQRELEADSTKHQREVADLQAAGLNPILATGMSGGSVNSSPASASASSAPPAAPGLDLGALLRGVQLDIERKVADSEVAVNESRQRNIDADTAKKEAETRWTNIQADVDEVTKDAKIEAAFLANQLDRAKIKETEAKIDECAAHVKLLSEQATTEESKRDLNFAEALLRKASAYQITQLLPYQKQLMAAETEQARAAAALSAAHTAYQNGLIDGGYLDNFIREQVATADSAEAKAVMDDIKQGIRTGNFRHSSFWDDQVPALVRGVTIFLDNLNPIAGLFK